MDLAKLFEGITFTSTMSKGDMVFAEGEPGNIMFVVKHGEVGVSIQGRQIEILGPGAIVGEMGLIDDRPRSATVTAHTDCELVPLTREDFLQLVSQTPEFALEVMRILVTRLRHMDAHV